MLDLNIVDYFDTARFIKCLKPPVNKGSLSLAGSPVQPRTVLLEPEHQGRVLWCQTLLPSWGYSSVIRTSDSSLTFTTTLPLVFLLFVDPHFCGLGKWRNPWVVEFRKPIFVTIPLFEFFNILQLSLYDSLNLMEKGSVLRTQTAFRHYLFEVYRFLSVWVAMLLKKMLERMYGIIVRGNFLRQFMYFQI